VCFNLIPKEQKFFDMFNKQAINVHHAAKYFNELVSNGHFNEDTVARMHRLEQEGDILSHEIANVLNQTFITPFDREDIFLLSNNLDNVVDAIDAITKRMGLYKLTEPDVHMKQFAVAIEQACCALHDIVKNLHNTKSRTRINDHCLEIKRIENLGDQLRETAIAELFEKTNDPIKIIKWKEMYEAAESTIDTIDHASKSIQSILVKQG
jgi:hypothetical protein